MIQHLHLIMTVKKFTPFSKNIFRKNPILNSEICINIKDIIMINKYIDTLPIDLVYLWVDDTDYNWKKKINRYRENLEQYDSDATDICRFYNNDELKYSLRSV